MRLQRLLSKGNPANLSDPLERIQFTTDLSSVRDVDFLIESATEKWEVKKDLYAQIDELCAPVCIFASNTSAIPITRIAAVTRRPAQVLGIHFMNPAPLKSVVEVVRGYHTSDGTVEAARNLLQIMGKDCIIVKDAPGFVSNRVLMLMIDEAIYLVHDGVAPPPDIDKLFRTSFGHKMGPLETADLIGLDTVLASIEVLYESFSDSKYRPCPLLRQMVEAGLRGQKSGQGFYTYQRSV
jgi:3-hydroxybutyryl-CoA dehydrogenase